MANTIQVTIPQNAENMQLPSPELLTFYQNYQDRVLWLDADVDEYCIELAKLITRINKEDEGIINPEDRKPIKLLIFSNGGSLDINNFVIDVIKLSKTHVYGFNMGICASAGCFIYLSCHKRFAMPNSKFLIHRGSAENISGTYDQILSYVMEYQRQMEDLANYILENTSIDEETLNENLGTEWYISAKDAHEKYGMVEGIVKSLDEVI